MRRTGDWRRDTCDDLATGIRTKEEDLVGAALGDLLNVGTPTMYSLLLLLVVAVQGRT